MTEPIERDPDLMKLGIDQLIELAETDPVGVGNELRYRKPHIPYVDKKTELAEKLGVEVGSLRPPKKAD